MTSFDTLLELAKGKLNITWNDEGTNNRLTAILHETCPTVSNMVGLTYDAKADDAYDGEEIFDFSEPSMERNIFLNFVSYEWNHQSNIFRENYWQEIAACRQQRLTESESDTDGGE